MESNWRPDLDQSNDVIANKLAKNAGIIEGMEHIINIELGGEDEGSTG